MLSLQNQNKILTSYIQKVDRMKEQCVSIHCYRPAVSYPTVLYYNLRCWLKCQFLPERRHNRFVVSDYNEPFFLYDLKNIDASQYNESNLFKVKSFTI